MFSNEGGVTDRLPGGLAERSLALDVILLMLVPALLVGVYTLPMATKRALALEYTAPTVVTAFASHFVHFSAWHLLVNLAGYALVVSTAYVLSRASGRRRQFWVVYVVFVLAFPFALSGLNLLFVRPRVGVGFSGVVMAFVGYLPVALLGFVGSRLDGSLGRLRSEWLFFFGLAVVAYVAAPAPYGVGLAAASSLAGVLFLLAALGERPWRRTSTDDITAAGDAEVTVLGLTVFLGYPLVAFPADPVIGDAVLNVYTHALGFCLGYLATYAAVLCGCLNVD